MEVDCAKGRGNVKTKEKESVRSRVIVRLSGALTRDDIEAGAVWRIAGHGFGID